MDRRNEKRHTEMARARVAKARKRLNGEAPDYPCELPDCRREIVIRDYDFGVREMRIVLNKSDRQDCYTMVIDGEVVDWRIGWSRILEYIRKEFPRVLSVY